MGSYNNEYESYYAKILHRQRENNPYASYGIKDTQRRDIGGSTFNVNGGGVNKNFIAGRVMQELIGVLCLTAFVIVCKTIVTPQTSEAYSYAKSVVSNNVDYAKYISPTIAPYIKNINLADTASIRNSLEDYVETFKANVTGEKTLKEQAKENFVSPIKGKINSDLSSKEKDKSLVIEVNAGTEVISPNSGTVKEIGEDKDSGSYILIDNGNGIETKVLGIKEIPVKKGEKIEKGEFIGKSDVVKSLNKACIIFSLSYMGENKDPREYITFEQ